MKHVDLIPLLQEQGISYATHGKNIGKGWTGVPCPSCGDTKNHCGVSPSGTNYTCWKCAAKGSIVKLLMLLLRISFDEANAAVAAHASKFYDPSQEHGAFKKIRQKSIELPGDAELTDLAKQYLINRKLDPEEMKTLYGVRDGGQTGDYKYRLIIPYYLHHRPMSFISRDMTGKQSLRYKNQPAELSVIETKQLLYGWDNIDEYAVLVEGVFDKYAIGQDCVATSGAVLTDSQISLLTKLKFCIPLFDPDAAGRKAADTVKSVMAFCGITSYPAFLPPGVKDPGKLNKEQRIKMRRQLDEIIAKHI